MELEDLSRDITEHVAKHLNPIDLLELSYASKDWDRLIKSFRIHIREFYLSLRGIADEEQGVADILFALKPVQRSFIHVFFYKRTDEQLKEIAEDPRTVVKQFNEIDMQCQVDENTLKIYCQEPIPSFYSVMNHLLDLFPGPIYHLQLANCPPKVDRITVKLLEHPKLSRCSKLTIPTVRVISDVLLRRILGLPNVFILQLFCNSYKQFHHYRPINIRFFTTSYAEWITRRSLFALNSESIELGDPRVTLKDLNAYMKKWLAEDSKLLKRFYCNFCRGWKWEHENKGGKDLFDGIEWKKYDPKTSKRPRKFDDKIKGVLDLQYGRDITRSDGAIATVMCDSSSFIFVVWDYPE